MTAAVRSLAILATLSGGVGAHVARAHAQPASGAPVHPATVPVTVVDVAADVAYITPGAAAGIRAGARVELGGARFLVIDATETSAAVRLAGARVALGATGVADAAPPTAHAPLAERAAVRPLDAWRGQWPDAVRPATKQSPAPVPLGSARPPGALHAAVIVHGRTSVERNGPAGSAAEAALELSVEPWRERPFAIDVDVAARIFGAGSTGPRAPLRVRTARVRWGDARDPALALGRLAWAAESVGLLDGVRAAGHRGELEIAGFGGVVPDPIDGAPDTSAARFGAEAIWDAPDRTWQPRVAVTAIGSTWDGALDERVLVAGADLRRGDVRLGGWSEVQVFSADNPWAAAAVELAGSGVTAGWRERGRHLDLDATFERPQRTHRFAIASAGDAWWADVSASAGTSGARWSLDATATLGTTHDDGAFVDAGALVLGEVQVLPHDARLLLGGAATRARFLDVYGLELGVATGGGRRWELSARWRPELVAYTGAIDRFIIHGAAVDGRWRILRSLDLGGSALVTIGDDREALAIITTLAWRPRP